MSKRNKSLKDLRTEAEAAIELGVANKEQLTNAVPVLVTLQEAVIAMSKQLSDTKDVIQELTGLCAKYALAHPDHVFSKTFSVAPNESKSGFFEVGETTYHFTHGFDSYGRIDSALKMTQKFLKTLPSEWIKGKVVLNTTGIKSENPTTEKLESYGLYRKTKDAWSKVVDISS